MSVPRPRVRPGWVTPEFLVFLLAVVLASGLFLLQIDAGRKARALTDAFLALRGRWTTLVQEKRSPGGNSAMWDDSLAEVRGTLETLSGLEPRLVPVVADLDTLPLQVGSLKEFAAQLSRFDEGQAVLEALRLRQSGAFQGGLVFTLLLGTAGFGLSMRRSLVGASSEAHLSRQNERRALIQEHERGRIARELHDGVAQDLARARLNLAQLDCRGCLQSGNQTARDDLAGALDLALKEIRWICGTLRQPAESLTTLDLVVEKCTRDFQSHYGLPVSLK